MNTNSYLTAAHATTQIESRIREATTYRLAKEARRTPDTQQREACCPPTRPSWFPRRVIA